MKIGIDAKWYFEGPPSGKRVVRNLVDHFLKNDKVNHYYLFFDRRFKGAEFYGSRYRNVTCCYVWADNNLISNVVILPRLSKRFGLDVVLYQNFISPFDKSKRIAYIHDVLFLSNPEYYTIYERLYFAPLRFLTKLAELVVTVSEEEKMRLLKYKYASDPDKVIVAYHGVDESFVPKERLGSNKIAEVRARYRLPEDFLLYVGRLNLRKNVDHLLEAIPLLKDKFIPLVIVGADDWKKSNHMVIIKNLGIEERVQFTGAIFDDLNVVYALGKVFCFPSYAESFGLPPLEAMAAGLPVVVSNTTSLPEICGEAGNFIDPNSSPQIAATIDLLLADQDLYQEKRNQGINRASTFTWDNTVQVLLNSMRRLVANK
jgi:glycosyltransferase involved in cell wall biosynthesis